MQETPRTGGINEEFGGHTYLFAMPRAFQSYLVVRFSEAGQICLVEIIHPQPLRFADEELIEIGAIPVRVRDLIVRACGDQKLIAAIRSSDAVGYRDRDDKT